MNENDRLFVFTLAKLRVVESALGALLIQSEHRESTKALVLKILALHENKVLYESMSDEEIAICEKAYAESYRAIFAEEPPTK